MLTVMCLQGLQVRSLSVLQVLASIEFTQTLKHLVGDHFVLQSFHNTRYLTLLNFRTFQLET